MECYLALKNNEILSFATKCWNYEYPTEWNYSNIERQKLHLILFMWVLHFFKTKNKRRNACVYQFCYKQFYKTLF